MDFNRTNMAKLIAHMEKMPNKAFRLDVWLRGKLGDGGHYILSGRTMARNVIKAQEDPDNHNCGTVACIGGTAAILARAASNERAWELPVRTVATEWLGISRDDAEDLFVPGDPLFRQKVTRKGAIRVLKHLEKTGKLDWNKANKEAVGVGGWL